MTQGAPRRRIEIVLKNTAGSYGGSAALGKANTATAINHDFRLLSFDARFRGVTSCPVDIYYDSVSGCDAHWKDIPTSSTSRISWSPESLLSGSKSHEIWFTWTAVSGSAWWNWVTEPI